MIARRLKNSGIAVGAVSLLLLSACGSDNGQLAGVQIAKNLGSAMTGSLKSAPAAGPKDLGLTRAALATILTPIDLVTIEKTGAQGVVAKTNENGGVITWTSLDAKSISTRNGIILATRGLGGDLMTAAVPTLAQISGGGGHSRTHVMLTGDDQTERLSFTCSISSIGSESFTIVERSYQTRHVKETCTGASDSFANDYWFQTSGKLRQSRQWVGKDVGYVLIKHLSE